MDNCNAVYDVIHDSWTALSKSQSAKLADLEKQKDICFPAKTCTNSEAFPYYIPPRPVDLLPYEEEHYSSYAWRLSDMMGFIVR